MVWMAVIAGYVVCLAGVLWFINRMARFLHRPDGERTIDPES